MQEIPDITANLPPYGNATLPPGIRSRIVNNVNGLAMHALEAGFHTKGRPCILLLHGFPELAYSWRKVMLPLAAAGYHAVAPDQRGYGRTTGWDDTYEGDLDSFQRKLRTPERGSRPGVSRLSVSLAEPCPRLTLVMTIMWVGERVSKKNLLR